MHIYSFEKNLWTMMKSLCKLTPQGEKIIYPILFGYITKLCRRITETRRVPERSPCTYFWVFETGSIEIKVFNQRSIWKCICCRSYTQNEKKNKCRHERLSDECGNDRQISEKKNRNFRSEITRPKEEICNYWNINLIIIKV